MTWKKVVLAAFSGQKRKLIGCYRPMFLTTACAPCSVQVLLNVLLGGDPAVVDDDAGAEDVNPLEDAADQCHGLARFLTVQGRSPGAPRGPRLVGKAPGQCPRRVPFTSRRTNTRRTPDGATLHFYNSCPVALFDMLKRQWRNHVHSELRGRKALQNLPPVCFDTTAKAVAHLEAKDAKLVRTYLCGGVPTNARVAPDGCAPAFSDHSAVAASANSTRAPGAASSRSAGCPPWWGAAAAARAASGGRSPYRSPCLAL